MARRFEFQHPGLLFKLIRRRKVRAARIGDGRNANAPLLRRQARHALQPFDAGRAEQLGVGHDVRLAHRHEVARAEIATDLDLMFDRPLCRRAELAGLQRFFLVGQFHYSGTAAAA